MNVHQVILLSQTIKSKLPKMESSKMESPNMESPKMEAHKCMFTPDGKVDYYSEFWEKKRAAARVKMAASNITPEMQAWMESNIVRPPRPNMSPPMADRP